MVSRSILRLDSSPNELVPLFDKFRLGPFPERIHGKSSTGTSGLRIAANLPVCADRDLWVAQFQFEEEFFETCNLTVVGRLFVEVTFHLNADGFRMLTFLVFTQMAVNGPIDSNCVMKLLSHALSVMQQHKTLFA